jgi:hypothetical protein
MTSRRQLAVRRALSPRPETVLACSTRRSTHGRADLSERAP